jgi:ribose transport system substrate-binding protein
MREDDVQGQIDILSKTVEHGAAGVILSPVEALPLRTPVRSALARGVPVVVVDTDLGLAPGSQLAYVLNDEQAGGRLAARRLGLLLKGHGAVAVLGIKKQLTSTTERARSLEATLAGEFPDIHVVFRSLARSTVSQEQQIAEKFLADGVHVDAIVALTEFSTRGAFYALTEAERVHQTPLIGFDQNILAPIRTGEIDSVVVQNTFAMGQIAMGLIDEALHGGMRHDRTTVQPLLATRENIDSEDMRKVLDLSWFQQ